MNNGDSKIINLQGENLTLTTPEVLNPKQNGMATRALTHGLLFRHKENSGQYAIGAPIWPFLL